MLDIAIRKHAQKNTIRNEPSYKHLEVKTNRT